MKVLVALGGNAIAVRGAPLTVGRQVERVRVAAEALAGLADEVESLVVTHGNGPQVGWLSERSEGWPLDVIGAETEGMIGYWIERELRNRLPERSIATLLTQVEVDAEDPAFLAPSKPIGPILSRDALPSDPLEGSGGPPRFVEEGDGVRRVVASPRPRAIVELAAIECLVRDGHLVVCAGGGGIPVVRAPDGRFRGVDAVVDKDRVAALLAEALDCEGLLLLTDVAGVYDEWPATAEGPIEEATSTALAARSFAPGSMGPKVESACRFASKAGRFAAIGALEDAAAILRGEAGTRILPG